MLKVSTPFLSTLYEYPVLATYFPLTECHAATSCQLNKTMLCILLIVYNLLICFSNPNSFDIMFHHHYLSTDKDVVEYFCSFCFNE